VAYAENTITNDDTATVAITFTSIAPVIVTAITDQTFYKGQGLTSLPGLNITAANTLTYSIVTNVSSSYYTYLAINSTTGDPIYITFASTFTGTAEMTITATDTNGYTISDSFIVSVNGCSQANCDTCTGTGDGDCTSCASTGDCYIGTTLTSLNSGVGDAKLRGGIGTMLFLTSGLAIGASMLSGVAPIITVLIIGQCQVVQVFSLFNMNKHRDYVKFSQAFSVTKLDFKFLDFIELQDSMETGTRRNLESNGYKDLANVRIDTVSFFVNYIYWFFVVLLLAIFHGIVILLLKLKWIKKEKNVRIKKTLKAIRKSFEFGVYFYMMMTISLFVWL
jgi:hypothetical protein